MSSPNIILIEHDIHIRELYEEIFASENFSIKVFSQIGPALKIIRKVPPKIIFLDIDLPRGGALKLLRKLREEKVATKVILLSNLEEKIALRDYLSLDTEMIIETASVSPNDIIMAVRKILNGK